MLSTSSSGFHSSISDLGSAHEKDQLTKEGLPPKENTKRPHLLSECHKMTKKRNDIGDIEMMVDAGTSSSSPDIEPAYNR